MSTRQTLPFSWHSGTTLQRDGRDGQKLWNIVFMFPYLSSCIMIFPSFIIIYPYSSLFFPDMASVMPKRPERPTYQSLRGLQSVPAVHVHVQHRLGRNMPPFIAICECMRCIRPVQEWIGCISNFKGSWTEQAITKGISECNLQVLSERSDKIMLQIAYHVLPYPPIKQSRSKKIRTPTCLICHEGAFTGKRTIWGLWWKIWSKPNAGWFNERAQRPTLWRKFQMWVASGLRTSEELGGPSRESWSEMVRINRCKW